MLDPIGTWTDLNEDSYRLHMIGNDIPRQQFVTASTPQAAMAWARAANHWQSLFNSAIRVTAWCVFELTWQEILRGGRCGIGDRSPILLH
jgi:uncharacterized protein YfaQ (DUF2300 family)